MRRILSSLFKEGSDSFKGGLSAGNYITITITDATRNKAKREILQMVELGILTEYGSLKSKRYWLNVENGRTTNE